MGLSRHFYGGRTDSEIAEYMRKHYSECPYCGRWYTNESFDPGLFGTCEQCARFIRMGMIPPDGRYIWRQCDLLKVWKSLLKANTLIQNESEVEASNE